MPLIVQRLAPKVSWVEHDQTKRRGLVIAVDVESDMFTVRYEGEDRLTPRCSSEKFSTVAPRGTVARGSLGNS